jgi:hypothetical protein
VILQRSRLGSFAESYALIHDELTAPDYKAARIHLQDLLVRRAAGVARQEKFEAREVRELFPMVQGMRVLVLGLMQGDGGRLAHRPVQTRKITGIAPSFDHVGWPIGTSFVAVRSCPGLKWPTAGAHTAADLHGKSAMESR